MLFFIFFAACLCADVAFGQEPDFVEIASLTKTITSSAGFSEFVGWMIGVQVVLRGTAEGLTRISVYTETKWDNKAAAIISQAAWVLGAGLGKLGYGVPKLVVEEKTKADAKKTS